MPTAAFPGPPGLTFRHFARPLLDVPIYRLYRYLQYNRTSNYSHPSQSIHPSIVCNTLNVSQASLSRHSSRFSYTFHTSLPRQSFLPSPPYRYSYPNPPNKSNMRMVRGGPAITLTSKKPTPTRWAIYSSDEVCVYITFSPRQLSEAYAGIRLRNIFFTSDNVTFWRGWGRGRARSQRRRVDFRMGTIPARIASLPNFSIRQLTPSPESFCQIPSPHTISKSDSGTCRRGARRRSSLVIFSLKSSSHLCFAQF